MWNELFPSFILSFLFVFLAFVYFPSFSCFLALSRSEQRQPVTKGTATITIITTITIIVAQCVFVLAVCTCRVVFSFLRKYEL